MNGVKATMTTSYSTSRGSAREELIESILPDLGQLAAKYAPFMPHEGYEDVLSICHVYMLQALENALQEHVQDRKAYLYRAVEYSLIGYLRGGHHRLIRTPDRAIAATYILSLDAPLSNDGGAYTLADTLADESDSTGSERDYEDIVERALDRLEDEYQREVVRRHWGIGSNAPESVYALRKATGRSTLFVQKQIAHALSRLREDRELVREVCA